MRVILISILTVGLIALSEISALSQCGPEFIYDSNDGRFSVTQIKGCAGLTVEICINGNFCSDGNVCFADYGDGNDGTFTSTYTYNTPGNYELRIIFPNPTPSDIINIEITDKTAPEFDLYACAGNTVRVDITDMQYDNYQINFGDGTQQMVPIGAPQVEHDYPNTNNRTVSVKGVDNNALDNCATATNAFTPITALPNPVISQLNVINSSDLALRYNLDPDIFYRLEIQPNGVGNFNFLKQLQNSQQRDTIRNLDLENSYYCFRIAAIDLCTNTATYSNIICSINLNLTIQDGANDLLWTTSTPSANFSVSRSVSNSNGNSTTDPFLNLAAADRFYSDTDITCNTQYCYTLYADYNGGRSTSARVCGTSLSTVPPNDVSDISIAVIENGYYLEWLPPTNALVDEYIIKKNGLRLGTTTETNFTDATTNADVGICYSIEVKDQCGNRSLQDKSACAILLMGTIAADNTISLSWNEYDGFANGVNSYRIEKYYSGALVATNNATTNTFSEVDSNPNEQIIVYRVLALPEGNVLPAAASNFITIIKPNNIYYPTAFTPDGNGQNDQFTVRGQFIVSYQLQIFNRWGEMIFASDNPDAAWDGTLNGKPVDEGTYIFNLDAVDLSGREIKKNGSFLLLRR